MRPPPHILMLTLRAINKGDYCLSFPAMSCNAIRSRRFLPLQFFLFDLLIQTGGDNCGLAGIFVLLRALAIMPSEFDKF